MTADRFDDGPRPHDPSRDGEHRRVPNPRRHEHVRENPAPPLGSPTTMAPRGGAGVVQQGGGAPVWVFAVFAVSVAVAAVAGTIAVQRYMGRAAPAEQQASIAAGAPVTAAEDDGEIQVEPYTPQDVLTARDANASLRSAPSSSAPVLLRLTPGDPVVITGRVAGLAEGWLVAESVGGAPAYVAAAELMPLRSWLIARTPAPSVQTNPPPVRRAQQPQRTQRATRPQSQQRATPRAAPPGPATPPPARTPNKPDTI